MRMTNSTAKNLDYSYHASYNVFFRSVILVEQGALKNVTIVSIPTFTLT